MEKNLANIWQNWSSVLVTNANQHKYNPLWSRDQNGMNKKAHGLCTSSNEDKFTNYGLFVDLRNTLNLLFLYLLIKSIPYTEIKLNPSIELGWVMLKQWLERKAKVISVMIRWSIWTSLVVASGCLSHYIVSEIIILYEDRRASYLA